MEKKLKILNLKSENVKGIKVIDITPKDNMVIISGKNGAGKTSAIDSLWYAVLWKSGSKGVPMPIRKGAKSADIQVTLCEDLTDDEIAQGKVPEPLFVINRKWTDNDRTYLEVTNGKGLVYKSPQKLLDDFVGFLSVDPRKFTIMSGKEHRDILIKITGFDVTEIEEKIVELREGRRLQGQTVKLYEGERDTRDFSGVPTEEISIIEWQNKLEEAIDHNRDIDAAHNKIEHHKSMIESKQNKILNLQAEIESLKTSILTDCTLVEREQKFIKENERVDIEYIRKSINASLTINEMVQAKNRDIQADKKRDEAQKRYDEFTQTIEDETAKIEKGLKDNWSKIPDQNLSLTETDIAYNGIPFSQISFSEQLKVAMKIAMVSSKKLNVVSISDYSLLDDKNKEIIRQMAKEFNCQVWAEEVDDTGTKGFYISEGEVKNES